MSKTILHNQSILDISIQHTGTVENVFKIAKENSIAVSDYLIPGYELVVPYGTSNNDDVLNYYNSKKIQPATGTTETETQQIPTLRGIGYMQISTTFKVSEDE